MKRVATMCVLRSDDRYLLMKRAKMPNAGLYVPVGGKLEAGERPAEAMLREVREETGLQLRSEDLSFGGILTETSPVDYNWLCYIYTARIAFVEPPYCDEGELAWIPATGLRDLPTPPTDWWVYQYLDAGKPFVFDALYDADLRLLAMWEEIAGVRLQ